MIYARKCDSCGLGMSNGYVINGGEGYFCNDVCLFSEMSEEKYLELYDNGNGDSYWTEWEDEDDYQYETDETGELIERDI